MKRFYTDVSVSEGQGVLLDGKPVYTPKKTPLRLPTPALAEVIAEEWRAQGEKIIPHTMPLTQLANAVLDAVSERRDALIDELAAYGGTDLLCYHAEEEKLAAKQREAWSPWLAWAAEQYQAELRVTAGIMPIAQDALALQKLRDAVAGCDDWALAAFAVWVYKLGSLVLALAVRDGALDAEKALSLAQLDEEHQAAQWGEDEEAKARREAIAQELRDAVRFYTHIKA